MSKLVTKLQLVYFRSGDIGIFTYPAVKRDSSEVPTLAWIDQNLQISTNFDLDKIFDDSSQKIGEEVDLNKVLILTNSTLVNVVRQEEVGQANIITKSCKEYIKPCSMTNLRLVNTLNIPY